MSARRLRTVLRLGRRAHDTEARLVPGEGGASRLELTLREGGATRTLSADVRRLADGSLRLEREGRVLRASVARQGDALHVGVAGRSFVLRLEEPGAHHHGVDDDEAFAVSPMTGVLAKVAVAPGQTLAEGAALFVVEAMKMEYVVRAPRAVTVAEVRRRAGDRVSLGEVIVAYAPEAPA